MLRLFKTIHPILTLSVWAIYSLFWFTTIFLATKKNNDLLMMLPVAFGLLLAAYLLRKRRLRFPDWLVVALLAGAVLIPRLYWVTQVRVIPLSDFATYFDLATVLARGEIGYQRYLAFYPHVIGYPLILSWVFRLFGSSLAVAQGLNIFFALGTTWITYFIVKKIASQGTGLISALLIALWPSHIFFSPLPSTEAAFAFFQAVILGLVVLFFDRIPVRFRSLFIFLLGIFVAFVNMIRPQGLVIVASLLIYLLVFAGNLASSTWLLRIGLVLTLLVGYGLATSAIQQQMERLIGQPTTNNLGYSLLVGSNVDSNGMFNEDDANALGELSEGNLSAPEVNSILMDRAIQRIRSNPLRFLKLQVMKNYNLWQSDTFGIRWTIATLDPNFPDGLELNNNQNRIEQLSNRYYFVVLILAALAGCLAMLRRESGWALLISLLVIGYSIGFMLVEAQNRYHYHVLPLMPILAGCSLAWVAKGRYIASNRPA